MDNERFRVWDDIINTDDWNIWQITACHKCSDGLRFDLKLMVTSKRIYRGKRSRKWVGGTKDSIEIKKAWLYDSNWIRTHRPYKDPIF